MAASGFPPREVKNDYQLKNNDNLIVEIALKPEAVEIKVNSDGSCLFNSLIKALCLPDSFSAQDMRHLIKQTILKDKARFNKEFLGLMEPEEYSEWICVPTNWGGVPELKILSELY